MGDSAKLIILIWESPEKSWPRFVFDHFSSHWSTLQYDSTNVCTVRTKGMLNNIKNLRRKKMSLPHRKRLKQIIVLITAGLSTLCLYIGSFCQNRKNWENSSKPIEAICILDLLLANTDEQAPLG